MGKKTTTTDATPTTTKTTKGKTEATTNAKGKGKTNTTPTKGKTEAVKPAPKPKIVKVPVKVQLVDPIIWTYQDDGEATETVTRKGKKIKVKVSELRKGDVIYDGEEKASFVVL
jgi:hypothetical protein